MNPDGSLDLLIQARAPAAAQMDNWLPVAADKPFSLTLRLCQPRPEALHGSWSPPGVQRIE